MKNIQAVVFDAYGTLFDVHSVMEKCNELFPGKGEQISQIWRRKQLEYTWLVSLMGRYDHFFNLTRKALVFTLKELKLEFDDEKIKVLLNEYLTLKPYPEVLKALDLIKGKKLAILTNGNLEMIQPLVEHASLNQLISNVISVDELKIYKPFQGVYQLAPVKLGVLREQTLFVSSNSWDVVGAKVFGFQVCWINRFNQKLDELDVKPDLVVKDLEELVEFIQL